MAEENKKTDEKMKKHSAKKQMSEKPKKTEAIVNGRDSPVSLKHAIAICNFIKHKNIETAVSELQLVSQLRKAVPMRGEIPHRKGKIMSGRFPVNASLVFIKLLNSLKSNAFANEMEIEKCKIICKANLAPRPYRRFGQTRFKRCHIEIKLVEKIKSERKEKK